VTSSILITRLFHTGSDTMIGQRSTMNTSKKIKNKLKNWAGNIKKSHCLKYHNKIEMPEISGILNIKYIFLKSS